MRLTVQSDYALRTLMYLAATAPRRATIREIAAAYGISRAHLMVLVHRLGESGFLLNERGRGGGIRLARPAARIGVGEVLRAVEPAFEPAECFDARHNQCRITPRCRLKRVFAEALNAWFAVLDGYTLADLVRRRRTEFVKLREGGR
jgi:Rrf2 family nitric oxide-sensitive transcriptional repressor